MVAQLPPVVSRKGSALKATRPGEILTCHLLAAGPQMTQLSSHFLIC